jgi:hypothetical protein
MKNATARARGAAAVTFGRDTLNGIRPVGGRLQTCPRLLLYVTEITTTRSNNRHTGRMEQHQSIRCSSGEQ